MCCYFFFYFYFNKITLFVELKFKSLAVDNDKNEMKHRSVKCELIFYVKKNFYGIWGKIMLVVKMEVHFFETNKLLWIM